MGDHCEEFSSGSRGCNNGQCVQCGSDHGASTPNAVKHGSRVLSQHRTLELALETAGHVDGTIIVRRGVVRARWRTINTTPAGRRVGEWWVSPSAEAAS